MTSSPLFNVCLVNGFWGQNIGNAFFNIGGAYVLLKAIGHKRLKFLQDQPAYWTFRDESKGNYRNAFALLDRGDFRLIVLQGPVLTKNFGNIWSKTFQALEVTGKGWAGIGIGLREYSEAERRVVADVLRRFPPLFLASRDSPTYEFLRALDLESTALLEGIDSAFFCRLAYEPVQLKLEKPLLALTFDYLPEPAIVPDPSGPLTVMGTRHSAKLPKFGRRMAKYGKATGILAHAVSSRRAPTDVNGMQVVRPSHRTNPHLPTVIYRRPGGFASDEPFSYLSVYASASLTLSDRVHACVASLCYGKQAMLFNTETRRSALFDRLGCSSINSEPVDLDGSIISVEFDELVHFLCSQIDRLNSPDSRGAKEFFTERSQE